MKMEKITKTKKKKKKMRMNISERGEGMRQYNARVHIKGRGGKDAYYLYMHVCMSECLSTFGGAFICVCAHGQYSGLMADSSIAQ